MVEKAGHLVTSGEVRMKRVQRVSFVAAGAALLLGIPALASAAPGQTAAGSQPAAALAAVWMIDDSSAGCQIGLRG